MSILCAANGESRSNAYIVYLGMRNQYLLQLPFRCDMQQIDSIVYAEQMRLILDIQKNQPVSVAGFTSGANCIWAITPTHDILLFQYWNV